MGGLGLIHEKNSENIFMKKFHGYGERLYNAQ